MTASAPALSVTLIGRSPVEETSWGSELVAELSVSGAEDETRRLSRRASTRPKMRRELEADSDGLRPFSDDWPLLASPVSPSVCDPSLPIGGVAPFGNGANAAEAPKV